MKALAFNEFGGPDKLRLQEVPEPRLGPSDVPVSVRACALNHLDLFVREGIPALKTPLPFWTGCDIAGDIAEIGTNVDGVKVGDRVCVNFFFSSRRRHTRFDCDWSSDVCSSD